MKNNNIKKTGKDIKELLKRMCEEYYDKKSMKKNIKIINMSLNI